MEEETSTFFGGGFHKSAKTLACAHIIASKEHRAGMKEVGGSVETGMKAVAAATVASAIIAAWSTKK